MKITVGVSEVVLDLENEKVVELLSKFMEFLDPKKVEVTSNTVSPIKITGTRIIEKVSTPQKTSQSKKDYNKKYMLRRSKEYPNTPYQLAISKFITGLESNKVFKSKEVHDHLARLKLVDTNFMSFYVSMLAESVEPRSRIVKVRRGVYKRV